MKSICDYFSWNEPYQYRKTFMAYVILSIEFGAVTFSLNSV